MWEETGSAKYRDIAQNFWDLVTGAPRVRHRRGRQLRALPAARRGGRAAVELHLRELRQLQPAQADQAAALPPADPDRPDRLLRAHAVQPDAGGAGPHLTARLQLLLHRPVRGRVQAPAAELLPRRQPRRLRHRLRHLHLRHRHRAGDAGQVRRHHLHPRRGRPVRQPVHPLAGPARWAGAAAGDRVPRRPGDQPVRGLRRGHDDPAGPRAGLGGRAADRDAQRRADPGRVDCAISGPVSGGWIAIRRRWQSGDLLAGHAADAAGLRAHARPARRAGGHVRAGRAERRVPRQPRPR